MSARSSAGGPSAGLERLREVVAARVERRSLRAVAREVGMSPSGLQKFLDGASPYSATRRKLERWFVRESAGSALAALRVLVDDLPPSRRDAAVGDMLASLESAFRRARRPVPPWIAELRAQVERG